jgi:hypothetical protein
MTIEALLSGRSSSARAPAKALDHLHDLLDEGHRLLEEAQQLAEEASALSALATATGALGALSGLLGGLRCAAPARATSGPGGAAAAGLRGLERVIHREAAPATAAGSAPRSALHHPAAAVANAREQTSASGRAARTNAIQQTHSRSSNGCD